MARNPLGNIHKHKVMIAGKKAIVFDASKRYTIGGKQRKKFQRCMSFAEAQTALVRFRAEIEQEAAQGAESRTFTNLVSFYKTKYLKPAVFQNGKKISGYKRNIKNVEKILELLESHFGAMPVTSITHAHIHSFKFEYETKATTRGSNPAVATVNEKLSVLRRLLSLAVQRGWLNINPFRQGEPLIKRSNEVKRSRMLTFEEEANLLAACRPHKQTVTYKRRWKGKTQELTATVDVDRTHLIPIIVCALDTAMRRGDIFNLTWRQVDLKNRVIYIEENAETSKTGTGGVLPMTDRLHEVFVGIREKQDIVNRNDKVFPKFEYKRAFNSACDEAGIADFQFRDLRSTAATRMILAGNPETLVMKITRHKNLRTFLEHYQNVDIANARTIGSNLTRFVQNSLSSPNESPNEKIVAFEKAT